MNFYKVDFLSELVSEFKIIEEIVKCKEFHRLKKISFLGFLNKIFDLKEEYSRYDHSLGVAYLALKFCELNSISKEEGLNFVIACLLHDIGHFALSHLSEKAFNLDHKENTYYLINNNKNEKKRNSLNSVFKKNSIIRNNIIEILKGQSKYNYFNEMITNPINIDTIDAINRCAYVLNNNFLDPISVISQFYVYEENLFLNKEKVRLIDNFWLLKNKIYKNYIYNEKNLKLEAMFNYVLEFLTKINNNVRFEEYYEMNDGDLIKNMLYNFDGEKKTILNRILEGNVLNKLNILKVYSRMNKYYIDNFSDFIDDTIKKKIPDLKIIERRRIREFFVKSTLDFYLDDEPLWYNRRYKINEINILICAFKSIKNIKTSIYIPDIEISHEIKGKSFFSKEPEGREFNHDKSIL